MVPSISLGSRDPESPGHSKLGSFLTCPKFFPQRVIRRLEATAFKHGAPGTQQPKTEPRPIKLIIHTFYTHFHVMNIFRFSWEINEKICVHTYPFFLLNDNLFLLRVVERSCQLHVLIHVKDTKRIKKNNKIF